MTNTALIFAYLLFGLCIDAAWPRDTIPRWAWMVAWPLILVGILARALVDLPALLRGKR